jgi:rhamnosyltransferase subunit B
MPIGSHGDVHPFLGIADAMRRRGHAVKFIASGYYQSLVGKMGLEFVPLGTAEDFLSAVRNPDIMHPVKGFALVGKVMGEGIPLCYRAILEHAVAGKTVLVYSTLAFGARLAQETLRLPGVSVHLQPSMFPSVYDTPKNLPIPSWTPRWMKSLALATLEKFVIDPVFGSPLNRFRAELHLPPVRHVLTQWCHSPDRVIGLFPDWFAPPQPDWPKQTVLTGFPLFDERDVTPISDDLARFLDNGSPPIAFTPGSAMMHGQEFFAAGAEACRILGRRGLLLSRHVEQIPKNLPPEVMHAAYAPFSQILPRCAALVHHGGIGTTAQGLACGVPALIMPMSYDQPDNAYRVKKLGVGDWLAPSRFKPHAVAAKLNALLNAIEVTQACKTIASRLRSAPDPLEQTAQLIEQLERSTP